MSWANVTISEAEFDAVASVTVDNDHITEERLNNAKRLFVSKTRPTIVDYVNDYGGVDTFYGDAYADDELTGVVKAGIVYAFLYLFSNIVAVGLRRIEDRDFYEMMLQASVDDFISTAPLALAITTMGESKGRGAAFASTMAAYDPDDTTTTI
jgi:hypothetical protein